MGDFIARCTTIPMPPIGPGQSLIDFEPTLENGEWTAWASKVPQELFLTSKNIYFAF